MNAIDSEQCERSIVLAADHVGKLRASDVMRVMEDYFFTYGSTGTIVEYISENRPDLKDEAEACRLELVPAIGKQCDCGTFLAQSEPVCPTCNGGVK